MGLPSLLTFGRSAPDGNIAEPVRAYRVLIEPEAGGKVIGERRPRLRHWQLGAIAASAVVAVAVTVVWLRP